MSDGTGIDIITEGEPDEGAYIALSTAENGGIWQQVVLGEQYTYYLEPAVGWKLHSVSFNNQDVTNDVTVNSMYTTPVITLKSNSLFVAFEQTNPETQAVRSTETPNQTKVLGRIGGVTVSGINAGDMIQVYSLDGRLIQMVKATGARADIDLPAKQLYIIKAGTKTVKVRL